MTFDESSWLKRPRHVSVVVDNESWILPYAGRLVKLINSSGDTAYLCRSHAEVRGGVIAFYLGCMSVTPSEILEKNGYNLVVHESDLPYGRGFAPLTWQILEGKNRIPICLVEADADVDSGDVYLRREIVFSGDELNTEIRNAQGEATIEICMELLSSTLVPEGIKQTGKPSYYKRRYPEDSHIDVNDTIANQFNILRVVDNDRYPAYFVLNGVKYCLKIEKCK